MDVRIVKDGEVEFRGEARDILRSLNPKQLKLMEDVVNAFLKNRVENAIRMNEVIFHGPATIIYWADGDKTVVKCTEGDILNPEVGVAMATLKKMLGSSYKEYKKHTIELIQEDAMKKADKIVKAIKKVEATNEQEA